MLLTGLIKLPAMYQIIMNITLLWG